MSVELELVLPRSVLFPYGLLFLREKEILYDQVVDLGTHETPVRVGRRADDGLSAYVERGIDEYPAPGALLERFEEAIVARVRLVMHRLNASGIVHMRDCGQLRALEIQFVDAEEPLL